MSIQTGIHLQAQPDFSAFRFNMGFAGSIRFDLFFTCQRPGIFNLTIEEHMRWGSFYPFMVTDEDADGLLLTIIQIIELYTGKYPDRVVRLKGSSEMQGLLFHVILRSQQEILCPLFTIAEEGRIPFFPFRKKGKNVFLLKRKPGGALKPHPIQLTLDTHSRLYGTPIQVQLYEEMHAGRG
jgi:hypothetical protein